MVILPDVVSVRACAHSLKVDRKQEYSIGIFFSIGSTFIPGL